MIIRVYRLSTDKVFLELLGETTKEGWKLKDAFDTLWREGVAPQYHENIEGVGFRVKI